MKKKLIRPSPDEDARIAEAIAFDPDSALDMSAPIAGIVRRQGWQTRINAALKRSKAG